MPAMAPLLKPLLDGTGTGTACVIATAVSVLYDQVLYETRDYTKRKMAAGFSESGG